MLNHLNAELNPVYYLLALLGAHHILHVSGARLKRLLYVDLCGDKIGNKAYLSSKQFHLPQFHG